MNVLAYVHLRNIHHCTGHGRVARELIEHVAQREDVNVHILADRADYKAVAAKVGHPWTSFPCHLFANDTSIQQAKWIVFKRPAAEMYWRSAQIVHCTMESYVPTAASRLVVTIHDAAYFDGAHAHNLATLKQQLKWRILYKTLSRTVDAFHTVSHFSAERLAEAFPAIRSRLHVIYNAVSPIFFKPCDLNTKAYLQTSDLKDKRFILLPGGLHYRKNAEMVLKAWPIINGRMPDLKLVIAGHNDPAYLPAARRLEKSIFLTGFVEDEQLRALYHGAQVVWFPSQYEGFGLPVLEAMACGAPVVASNSTAIPEISGGAAILVNHRSVDENVQSIEAVLNNEQLRANLRERGIERAKPFTWAASAKQLHAVYSELV